MTKLVTFSGLAPTGPCPFCAGVTRAGLTTPGVVTGEQSRGTHLSCLTFDAAQDVSGFLVWKCTLQAHVLLPSISLTFENAYLGRGNIETLTAVPRSRNYRIAIHHSPTALHPYCFPLEVEIGLPFKIFSFRYWKESISIMLIGYILSV